MIHNLYQDNFKVVKNIDGSEGWYDSKGNVVYFKNFLGTEFWYEYDSKGNIIHFNNSDGEVHQWNWDNREGGCVHSKHCANGAESWYDYHDNLIYFKDSYGTEFWYEYDRHGNTIHTKDSDGNEHWWDSNSNPITKKQFDDLRIA